MKRRLARLETEYKQMLQMEHDTQVRQQEEHAKELQKEKDAHSTQIAKIKS